MGIDSGFRFGSVKNEGTLKVSRAKGCLGNGLLAVSWHGWNYLNLKEILRANIATAVAAAYQMINGGVAISLEAYSRSTTARNRPWPIKAIRLSP
jgi:hypothetical protein